jgi:hypothetical protein
MGNELLLIFHAACIVVQILVNILMDRQMSKMVRGSSGIFRDNCKAFMEAGLMGNIVVMVYFLSRFCYLLSEQSYASVEWIFDVFYVLAFFSLLLSSRKLIFTMCAIKTEVLKE